MSATFAEIVEDVKQLTPSEQEELHELLRKYLIDERRREIFAAAETGLREYRDGLLQPFSGINHLLYSLNHD